MKNFKPIPKFKDEDEEQKFWANNDSADYIDWSQSQPAMFSNLKPSTRTISIRLPEHLLNRLKASANRQDIPYQSYIKTLLDKAVK